MELANLANNDNMSPPEIRFATKSDASHINQLLQTAPYRHLHVDWHLPVDWIGAKTFLVQTQTEQRSQKLTLTNQLFEPKMDMQACLAITPDPLPAAWVRLAAVQATHDPQDLLYKLLTPILKTLKDRGVTEIGWLPIESWPEQLFSELGFSQQNQIITYRKVDVEIPSTALREDVVIRPVKIRDMERLADIEALAFDPLWRHSAQTLTTARSQAFSFDVAIIDEQIVGFQLSARGRHGAHLARLTVDPGFHGQGIGSTLLAHAFAGYHKSGLVEVSLNTPVDNIASQILYKKFGFVAVQDIFPVWVMNL